MPLLFSLMSPRRIAHRNRSLSGLGRQVFWPLPGFLFWLCCSFAVFAAQPPEEAQVHQLARAYYDASGEWAGKFTIVRIMKTRLETISETRIVAHLQYQAAFIQAPEHTSIDQRTFDLVHRDGQWQVINMGAHQSGRP